MVKVALPEPPLAGQVSSTVWWQDPAGVEAAGCQEAVGLSGPRKPLSFLVGPVLHPVVKQIRHKGAAKDQDCGEDKKDDPDVTEVHNRVFTESALRFLQTFVTSTSGSSCGASSFPASAFPPPLPGCAQAGRSLVSTQQCGGWKHLGEEFPVRRTCTVFPVDGWESVDA